MALVDMLYRPKCSAFHALQNGIKFDRGWLSELMRKITFSVHNLHVRPLHGEEWLMSSASTAKRRLTEKEAKTLAVGVFDSAHERGSWLGLSLLDPPD